MYRSLLRLKIRIETVIILAGILTHFYQGTVDNKTYHVSYRTQYISTSILEFDNTIILLTLENFIKSVLGCQVFCR